MGDVAKGIKSFKKGIQDDPAAPATKGDPKTIEHGVTENAASPSKAESDIAKS
jgi:hypothetical protein